MLYFDSKREFSPLVSQDSFAKAVLELDAIRQGKDANESIDFSMAGDIESRFSFQPVDVSWCLISLWFGNQSGGGAL